MVYMSLSCLKAVKHYKAYGSRYQIYLYFISGRAYDNVYVKVIIGILKKKSSVLFFSNYILCTIDAV